MAGSDTAPPPPPPPRGGRSPQSPPTAHWDRPPFTTTPPRPADGPTAPWPQSPPWSAPATVVQPELSVRLRRRFVKLAGGVVVALSLVSGGFALGTVLSEDRPGELQSTAAPAIRASNDRGTLPVTPGPVAGDDADEPVAAVAAAVSPSVVLIGTSEGQGSGIVWDEANGYIVTNQHVIGDSTEVDVLFADGTIVGGEVVGGSPSQDVAVVRVDPAEAPLVAAVFAPTSTVEVGQLAVAIGSPFGLDQTVTAGVVSAVRINPQGGADPLTPIPVEMVQTDAPINPGNSGGALADRQGRVIGMNTSIRIGSEGGQGNIGVGFAVPSDTIVLIAQRIVNGESLDLGYLGIASNGGPDNGFGVLVTEVVPDSPADSAGINVGDRIVGLDGDIVVEIAELSAAIKLYRPGDLVQLELERDGTTFAVDVELGSFDDS